MVGREGSGHIYREGDIVMPSRFPLHVSGGVLALGVALPPRATPAGGPRARAEDAAQVLPVPAVDVPSSDAPQTAVLSGGCFWGVQGVFEHVRGVHKVLAGYSGGSAATGHYETVSEGDTGHAESVQV